MSRNILPYFRFLYVERSCVLRNDCCYKKKIDQDEIRNKSKICSQESSILQDLPYSAPLEFCSKFGSVLSFSKDTALDFEAPIFGLKI